MYINEPNLKKRSRSTINSFSRPFDLWKQEPGADPVKIATDVFYESIANETMVGWDIPDYSKRKRKGELLPYTPFDHYQSNGSGSGTCDYYTTAGTHVYAPDGWPSLSGWVVNREDLLNEAPASYDEYVAAAAARIYSNGFDALTFLAELKDVVKLYKSIAKKLRNLKYSNSVIWRKVKQNWKNLPSEWLEIRYGWRPIVYDIIALNELVANWNDVRTRYSERVGNKFSNTVNEVIEHEWGHLYLDQTIKTKITTSIRGSVVADIEVPKLQFNPIVTAWELVPLSFVLDWFVDVGIKLSAISFACKTRAYSAACSYRIEMTRTSHTEISGTKSTFDYGTVSQYGTCTARLDVRSPCRIPFLPQFALKLNTFKVMDLVSLIVQRLN